MNELKLRYGCNLGVFAYDGQAIGIGAGQQSRIHCTHLAGGKPDVLEKSTSSRPIQPGFFSPFGVLGDHRDDLLTRESHTEAGFRVSLNQ